ncbi:hypothetical protein CR513_56519, partial [Mucuna pruriens]
MQPSIYVVNEDHSYPSKLRYLIHDPQESVKKKGFKTSLGSSSSIFYYSRTRGFRRRVSEVLGVLHLPYKKLFQKNKIFNLKSQYHLRRSAREKRNVILYDCIVFIQEHKVDIGVIEDDLINFSQAMENSNSQNGYCP